MPWQQFRWGKNTKNTKLLVLSGNNPLNCCFSKNNKQKKHEMTSLVLKKALSEYFFVKNILPTHLLKTKLCTRY